MITPNVIMILVSVLVGWIALWPARKALGAVPYHLAALPVGMVGWTVVAMYSMASGGDFGRTATVTGLGSYTALLAIVATLAVRGDTTERPVRWWTFAIHLLWLIPFALKIADMGIATYSADSWGEYATAGFWLAETGMLTPRMVAFRMNLVPSLMAANTFFGGQWTYVIFPVVAAHVLGWVGYSSYEVALSGLKRPTRIAVSLGAVAILASTATFLFHSVYVHTHMISAIFLLVGVVGVIRAIPWEDGADASPSWLMLAGIAAAGISLSRPDGIAYVMVIVAVLAVRALGASMDWWRLAWFYGPLVSLYALNVLIPVASLGHWETGKLESGIALGLLAAQCVVAALLAGLLATIRDRDLAMRLAHFAPIGGVALGISAFMILSTTSPDDFSELFTNVGRNTTAYGGWNSFWWFAAAVVAVLVIGKALRDGRPEVTHLLFGLAVFVIVAFVVHGMMHPGRIGWGDSLNRVLFHAMPLFALAWAMLAGGVARLWGQTEETA